MNQARCTDLASMLASCVAPVLVGSAFERRVRWPKAVVVIRPEVRRVTSRGDFAAWLASNDLHGAARECITRRVGPGELFVWIEWDDPNVALAGFVCFDLAAELRKT